LGGRPITETTGIILVCFDGKYTWAYKKILKIKTVCLRTYYIAGYLKQPHGPDATHGLGSLALAQTYVNNLFCWKCKRKISNFKIQGLRTPGFVPTPMVQRIDQLKHD